MSAILYAVKVGFCFLTPNGISIYQTYHLWPFALQYLRINNNSQCLFVGAPHRHYKDFRRYFEK